MNERRTDQGNSPVDNELDFECVAAGIDVAVGTTRAIEANGRKLRLCNVDGVLYAIEDRCTHAGIPFEGGKLRGCILECPMHGARFDVRDGKVATPPARRPLTTVPVRRRNGRIEIGTKKS